MVESVKKIQKYYKNMIVKMAAEVDEVQDKVISKSTIAQRILASKNYVGEGNIAHGCHILQHRIKHHAVSNGLMAAEEMDGEPCSCPNGRPMTEPPTYVFVEAGKSLYKNRVTDEVFEEIRFLFVYETLLEYRDKSLEEMGPRKGCVAIDLYCHHDIIELINRTGQRNRFNSLYNAITHYNGINPRNRMEFVIHTSDSNHPNRLLDLTEISFQNGLLLEQLGHLGKKNKSKSKQRTSKKRT